MEPNVITDLQDFMNHIDNQENTLQSREQVKEEYTKNYFS